MVRGLGARTPLHWAAASNNVGRLEQLLVDRADLEARDRMGFTALHVAVGGWNVEATGMLLAAGADVEAETTQGATPLLLAVNNSRGRCDLIDLLVAHGARATHANQLGQTPRSIAHGYSDPAVERALQPASH